MTRLLVLGWHNVANTWGFPAPAGAGLRGLTKQLTWLRRFATVVPLAESLERLARGQHLPARSVALTFDDGYADNLSLAAPVLSRLGLPATFFLVPGLLDREVRAWWEDLGWAFGCARRPAGEWGVEPFGHDLAEQRYHSYRHTAEGLKQVDRATREESVAEWVRRLDPSGEPPSPELFLDWAGARALRREGFAVGSHSSTHAVLSRETAEAQEADLSCAAGRLRSQLGLVSQVLAYPNGTAADYDAATLAAAASAGHRFALTTRPGLNGPGTAALELRRSVVAPDWGARAVARELRWAVLAGLAQRRRGD